MTFFSPERGRGVRGLRRVLLLLSIAIGLAALSTGALADLVATPLCSEVHGFAGEFNDHFSIPVETAPADGEAIVLIARTYPESQGMLLEKWLYLSATFHLAEGPTVTRTSDSNGVLEVPNVASNTDIEVRVLRVRPDGPVPFRFFSFFANKPVCHVAVSPQNSFSAPVPHRLAGSSKAVTMYFKTSLTADLNAASISIVSDGRTNQPFQVMDKDGAWQSHASTDLIQSSTGSSISFSFSPAPDDAGSAYCFTAVWVSYATVQGGTALPAATTKPGDQENSSVSSQPPQGQSTTTTTAAPAPTSESMSLLRRLTWLLLLCFVAWQAVLALYNYRVLGKRDVMDIIPCAETVAAGARGVQLVASRGLGASHRRSDGYDPVQSMNDPYA